MNNFLETWCVSGAPVELNICSRRRVRLPFPGNCAASARTSRTDFSHELIAKSVNVAPNTRRAQTVVVNSTLNKVYARTPRHNGLVFHRTYFPKSIRCALCPWRCGSVVGLVGCPFVHQCFTFVGTKDVPVGVWCVRAHLLCLGFPPSVFSTTFVACSAYIVLARFSILTCFHVFSSWERVSATPSSWTVPSQLLLCPCFQFTVCLILLCRGKLVQALRHGMRTLSSR